MIEDAELNKTLPVGRSIWTIRSWCPTKASFKYRSSSGEFLGCCWRRF